MAVALQTKQFGEAVRSKITCEKLRKIEEQRVAPASAHDFVYCYLAMLFTVLATLIVVVAP